MTLFSLQLYLPIYNFLARFFNIIDCEMKVIKKYEIFIPTISIYEY